MRNNRKTLNLVLAVGLLAGSLSAQELSASRHDSDIQVKVSHEFAKKSQFQDLKVSVDEGIVTLTGTVGIYQQKLDAAHKARKTHDVEGVRNLIEVSGKTVSDDELAAQLDKGLYYDRIGYENEFHYI